jgi:AcrR family transcriptional regulator
MSRPPRNTQAPNLLEAIKTTAWEQIAETGAASLSLRAIAQALGITAPAIYNYYPRRDDLVTALIIDAYTSFGDSQLAARDLIPAANLPGRLWAIGVAYRSWALAHPQRYQLIFGAPLPGYVAPVEQVLPAAVRSISALLGAVEAVRQAGRLRAAGAPAITPDVATMAAWDAHSGQVHPHSMGVAIYIWSCVHGMVSLEIAGMLPPNEQAGDALYHFGLRSLQQQLITEDA